jgi:hypothetical protein
MIKLINILKEGRIYLTADETRQIEEMIPGIIDAIKGGWISKNDYKEVGQINYESADKTPGSVKIYIANDYPNAGGYFQTNDPKNSNDNAIVIQQGAYDKYFTNIDGLINKTHKILTGDENAGIESLRRTLKHELIHAKDPARNQYRSNWSIVADSNLWVATYTSGDGKRTKSFKFKSEDEAISFVKQQQLKSYDPNDPQNYYKSWTEFQTMTGQFFEVIVAGINRIDVSTIENVKKIEIALSEILNFFSGKSTEFSQETYDFIQNTQSRNLFQKLIKSTENFIVKSGFTFGNKPTESALDTYIAYINLIKTYNPEGYKEFLKDLYKLIDIVKDQLNKHLLKKNIQYQVKVKEMQYINEVKRFQKLANIINESKLFEAESLQAIDTLVQKAKSSGADVEDEKTQMDILNKIIDSGFNPEKIDPKQIKEYQENTIEESGGGIVASSIEVLEHAEIAEHICHALHIEKGVFSKGLKILKKILNWPFKLIEKGFFALARLCGASIETSRIAGLSGLILFALICIIYGALHYPAIISSLAGVGGILAIGKLLVALAKSASGIFSLWKKASSAKEENEDVEYTIYDFFSDIEAKYKKITGNKIPNNWIFSFKEWFEENEKNIPNFTKYLKQLSDAVNSNKGIGGHIQNIIQKVSSTEDNKKILDIFNNILSTFQTTQQPQQESINIESIVNEALRRYRRMLNEEMSVDEFENFIEGICDKIEEEEGILTDENEQEFAEMVAYRASNEIKNIDPNLSVTASTFSNDGTISFMLLTTEYGDKEVASEYLRKDPRRY